jgi:hypothetical protein
MNEVIKVYSHVRSGTHLLMSVMYENFYKGREDLHGEFRKVGHWSHKYDGFSLFKSTETGKYIPWRGLFGRHGFYPVDDKSIVYIYRDGRDVMQSMYNFYPLRSQEDQALSFSEYIKKPMDWWEGPNKKCKPKMTPVEHWYNSVDAWINSKATLVRYEDLVSNPYKVIKEIEEKFELKRKTEDFYLGSKKVGLAPQKAIIGSWREYFSKEDVDYFNSVVPSDFEGLYGVQNV